MSTLCVYAGLLAAVNVEPVADVGIGRFDDFIGDTIDPTYATATGTSGTVTASSGSGVHAALLTTSTTSGEYITLALLVYSGLQF